MKMKSILLVPRRVVCWLIRVYQKTLSPDHGMMKPFFPDGYCRFYPSCSEYGYQAVKKYGVVRGGIKAAWRVLRCNPCGGYGNDPLK